jgi:DNA uptake protein ComE-like DNA-binding protein
MKSKESRKSGLSESFIIGVIAIVFLLIGYQVSLFIHRAAVTKIAANRDRPDTVFVYRQQVSSGSAKEDTVPVVTQVVETAERHNSSHSPRAEAVRKNAPRPQSEPFMFDPNTVSVEDLCRLGFSIKQAESIDNYRKKGGKFRRKEDFAKSYVVSESVYARLEAYIDIPLVDLNLADSAAFDALPGIGGWYAAKMIEHRNKLGGYTCIEQLLEIYRFDQEKFDALSDLICVGDPFYYQLWSLPADSLRLHPYIRNYETAKAIVLFRENNDPQDWTVHNLCVAGVLSEEDADCLARCVK